MSTKGPAVNRFGADTDEDVTDWGEVNLEEKRRAEVPTAEQLYRAAIKWQAAKRFLHEDHAAYFYENWQALPGLRQYVETEVAADTAAASSRGPDVTDEELAKTIFHKVLDDLTDRRGIRQSPLSEMKDIMRHPEDRDSDLAEAALECEETNVAAIVALLAEHRPA